MRVHLLAPTGLRDRPSGGNVYDVHLRAGLVAHGWEVQTHEVSASTEVAAALTRVAHGELVLVDSLVASWSAEVLLTSGARVVPLVHMLFGTPGERELLRQASAVIVTSEWSRRQVLADRDVDPRQVHVAVPGVERAALAPGSESGRALLCVASVVRAKGHDVLLEALGRLTDLDWHCTLVGSLDLEPDFVEELAKSAADSGIADRVELTGPLAYAGLGTAYAGSDLLVLPSRAETYGMVVAEALVRGLPVVASSVGGVPEALGTAVRPGMLVRPEDPDALARALRRWLEDAALRQWLHRAAGLRRATLPWWSTTAAQVAAALESVR
jgi:glycosyltransferase involved in cell wall biosynthesis